MDNGIYHVINRGNGRQTVFHKDRDSESFLKLLQEAKERNPVKLYGYCLMPNHFHMAVRPEKGEDLSKWMQWLLTSHVRRYHRHYERGNSMKKSSLSPFFYPALGMILNYHSRMSFIRNQLLASYFLIAL